MAGIIVQAWTLVEQGQTEEGVARLHQALTRYGAINSSIIYPYFLGLFADAQRKAARPEEGLAAVKVTDPRPLSPDPHSEAEACFLKAIEIARQQQAKSLEPRATMNLARLWQQQGKHHAARNMLSEIYGWFTEGFDTKDLQEAKALLQVLNS